MLFRSDVVVIPELRAVYVDIVKAASESIRSALEDNFHASWSADLGQYKHPVTGRPQRSSTSYLTDDVLANYTFFTFVRDPNTRFRSSYEQAICRERCTLCTPRGAGTMYTPTIAEITARQGYDLYAMDVNGRTLHKGVAFLLGAIADPRIVHGYAEANVAPGPGGYTYEAAPYNGALYDALGRTFRAGIRFKM